MIETLVFTLVSLSLNKHKTLALLFCLWLLIISTLFLSHWCLKLISFCEEKC